MLNELFHYIGRFIQIIYSKLLTEKRSIFTIIIYFIVFFCVFLATKLYYTRDEIEKNWDKYKCQPHILPIAGLFKGENFFQFTRENFTNCYWLITKEYFFILIKPIKFAFDTITRILGDAANSINQLRNMARLLRELFQNMIAEVFERIQTNVSAVQFYSEKFRNLMKKQHAIFQMIYYYLETIRLTFDSFVKGPTPIFLMFLMIFGMLTIFIISMCLLCPIPFVGLFACPICYMCFDPKQEISILDKKIGNNSIINTEIRFVEVGDIISHGNSHVISTFHFVLGEYVPLYQYKNIRLSASHIIFKDGIAVRAIDCHDTSICGFTKTLVCLGTSDNKIRINNSILSDYNEIDTPELSIELNNRILTILNHKPTYYDDFINYPTGFIDIDLNKDTQSIITHLILDNNIKIYNYKGVICSGNNIVYENGLWIRVYQSSEASLIENHYYLKIYNTVSKDGVIIMNGYKFRDFMETDNTDIHNWLHDMDINLLNKK
jgi:hypothetical protein